MEEESRGRVELNSVAPLDENFTGLAFKRLLGISNHGSPGGRDLLGENGFGDVEEDDSDLVVDPSAKSNFPTVSPSPEKETRTEVYGNGLRTGGDGSDGRGSEVGYLSCFSLNLTFPPEVSGFPEVS